VLMNDQCYGVIRNIQDAQYGGRRMYVDLHQPEFAQFCASLKLKHLRLATLDDADALIREGFDFEGPVLLEVDMKAVGSFETAFAGPPVRKEDSEESQHA